MNQKGFTLLSILLVIVTVILLLTGVYYFQYFQNFQTRYLPPIGVPSSSLPTPTPTATPDPTANWKTYTSKDGSYSLKYPADYVLVSDDNNSASFGFGDSGSPVTYLTISKNITDTNSLKLCSQLAKDQNGVPIVEHCISSGSAYGDPQSDDISMTTLGGKNAKRFYLGGGVDYAYHVVQTVDSPKFELKMDIAGGGLNDTFNKILSTFKFN